VLGEEKDERTGSLLFLALSCRIRDDSEYARSLPTAFNTRAEYCNHVPETEEDKEDEKQENANFGRKALLCGTISRLFEKRLSRESVVCIREDELCVRAELSISF